MKKIFSIKLWILFISLVLPIAVFMLQTTPLINKSFVYQFYYGLGFVGSESTMESEWISEYDGDGNLIKETKYTYQMIDFSEEHGIVGETIYKVIQVVEQTMGQGYAFPQPEFICQYADYVTKVLIAYVVFEFIMFIPFTCYNMFDKFIRRNE